MLNLVLPKGSLESPTLTLFTEADLPVMRSSSVAYNASIDDPRVTGVRILRPQEIPTYIDEGIFDLGITGRDWIEETSSDVVSLGQLKYSKNTSKPVRLVVAVKDDSPVESVADLADGVRVSTEYPNLTKKFFEKKGIDADIRLSYGATEAKVPDIVDVAVDLTETGSALRAANLKIIDVIVESYTEVVANKEAYADKRKRHAMHQLMNLLIGTINARSEIMIKINVPDAICLDKVVSVLPPRKIPTVNQLYNDQGFSIEVVLPRYTTNVILPEIIDAGGSDIIELPISKMIRGAYGEE